MTFCGARVHWKRLWLFTNIQYALSINIRLQNYHLAPSTFFFFLKYLSYKICFKHNQKFMTAVKYMNEWN